MCNRFLLAALPQPATLNPSPKRTSALLIRCSIALVLLSFSTTGPAAATLPPPQQALCPALQSAIDQSKTDEGSLEHGEQLLPLWVHCTFGSWADWSRATNEAAKENFRPIQARGKTSSRIVLTTAVVPTAETSDDSPIAKKMVSPKKVYHLPALIVAGVQKAGTTHLRFLLQQQDIFSAGTKPSKEVHFFDDNVEFLNVNGKKGEWKGRHKEAYFYSINKKADRNAAKRATTFTQDAAAYHARLETGLPKYYLDFTPNYINMGWLPTHLNLLLPFVRIIFIL